MNLFTKKSIDVKWVFLLTSCVFVVLLNHRPLNNPDESRYSEIALEMLQRGDFITPYFNGVLFLDKPPLYYWLQAIAIKLFGLSNASLRFFPAVFGLMGAACIYHCSKKLFNQQTATIASAVLLTSPLYFFISLYANLDMEVAVLISNALLLFSVAAFEKTTHPARYYYGAYFCGALAFLTKGMIGIVLPGLSIFLFILFSQRWHLLLTMRIPTGLLLVLAINLPWYYLAEQATPGFLHFFFYEQQFSRYVGHQFNAQNPFYFYPLLILAGTFPWSVFSLQALYLKLKNCRQSPELLYFLCWFIGVTVFFSIPASKLPSYIIPALPPLAVIIAYYLCHEGVKNQLIRQAYWVMFVISLILLCGLVISKFLIPFPVSGFLLVTLTAGMLLLGSSIFLFTSDRQVYWRSYFVASLIGYGCLTAAVPHFIEFIANDKPTNASTTVLAQSIKSTPHDRLYAYQNFYYDLPIMLQHPVKVVANWQEKGIEQHDSWLGKLAWGQQKSGQPNPNLILPHSFWQNWHSQARIIVITRTDRLNEFKDYQILKRHKRNVLISNQPTGKEAP